MNAEKRTKFDALSSSKINQDHTRLYEFLDPSKVEQGYVMVQNLLETSKVKASLLCISPGGKIKEYLHTDDIEYYIFPDAEKVEACHKGEAHSLTNYSETEHLFVISLKCEFDSTNSEDKLYHEEQYESVISTIKSGEVKQLGVYKNSNIGVYMIVFYPGASLKEPKLREDGWIFILDDGFKTGHWQNLFNISNPSNNKPLYVLGLKYK